MRQYERSRLCTPPQVNFETKFGLQENVGENAKNQKGLNHKLNSKPHNYIDPRSRVIGIIIYTHVFYMSVRTSVCTFQVHLSKSSVRASWGGRVDHWRFPSYFSPLLNICRIKLIFYVDKICWKLTGFHTETYDSVKQNSFIYIYHLQECLVD